MTGARGPAPPSRDPPARPVVGPPLSRRERQVAALVAEGLTDREIARRLFISERTAEGHLQQIRNKLGFDTRAQIASWVTRQMVTPAAPGGAPSAWAEPEPAAHNLPGQLTSFIGRDRELGDIRRLLQRTRLLTIVGPGGCGKTRLAVQAAGEVLHRFPGGAWFVDLSPVADPALVSQALASALAIREREGADLLDTVAAELRSRRGRLQCLVILDNCEHVIERCAGVAGRLLGDCPALTVLCTSREPLHVTGEAVSKLAPLSLPDPAAASAEAVRRSEAVRLFVDRASLADPAFALDDGNAALVAQVCHQLDGIPLALELAAAQVGAMTLDRLRRHLERRIGPIWRRATPSRQQTMSAAVDWSYELLGAAERRVFRMLSVFRGGFTLEAAEAVTGEPPESAGTFEVLTALVDKSLLVRAPTPRERYRMFDTIRRRAFEKLGADGETEPARRRHFDYFLALAERAARELTGPDQSAWLERLGDDHDNLRSAFEAGRGLDVESRLRLALALERFWLVRGHLSEGRAWFEEALSTPAPATAARARALNAAAGLAYYQGDLARARERLEASLAVWRDLSQQMGIQAGLANVGVIAMAQGDWEGARTYFGESLGLARRLGNQRAVAIVLDNLGLMAGYLGDHAAALADLEEGLAIMRRTGDADRVANSLANLGLLALYRGCPDEAGERYAESLDILRSLGERRNLAECLEGFAWIAASRGHADRALRLAGAADAIRESIGAPHRPWSLRVVDELRERASAAVGRAGAAAWEEGRGLDLDRAIALALEERPPAGEGRGPGSPAGEPRPGSGPRATSD